MDRNTSPRTVVRKGLWLLAASALALTIPLAPTGANAAEGDACVYGYSPDSSVFFGIGAGDSGVTNYDAGDGCTVMDLVMDGTPFKNHGQFVSTVNKVTNELLRDGVLTQDEKSDITAAATASEVGKPLPVTGTRSVDLDRIGLVGFTVRADMPDAPAETLAALAQCGFRNIEPSGRAGNFYGMTAAELAPLTEAAGFNVPSIGVSIGNLENDLDLVIAEAQAIGAEYVRVSGGWDTLAEYSANAEILNTAGAALEEFGIKVGYHNHGREFEVLEDGITGYDVLVRETNPDWVTMELDVYWAGSVGTHAVDLFETYPGRFELLHLKDLAEDGSFADVGEGTIDFAEIFAKAPLAGVQYGFTEHDRPTPDGITSACNSLSNLIELRY